MEEKLMEPNAAREHLVERDRFVTICHLNVFLEWIWRFLRQTRWRSEGSCTNHTQRWLVPFVMHPKWFVVVRVKRVRKAIMFFSPLLVAGSNFTFLIVTVIFSFGHFGCFTQSILLSLILHFIICRKISVSGQCGDCLWWRAAVLFFEDLLWLIRRSNHVIFGWIE